jgi:hypothetical protein
MKHLQHTSKTSETLNIHLQHAYSSITSTCYLDEWRLVDAKLDAGTELNVADSLEGGFQWAGCAAQPR